jgi:hypothetical protein
MEWPGRRAGEEEEVPQGAWVGERIWEPASETMAGVGGWGRARAGVMMRGSWWLGWAMDVLLMCTQARHVYDGRARRQWFTHYHYAPERNGEGGRRR